MRALSGVSEEVTQTFVKLSESQHLLHVCVVLQMPRRHAWRESEGDSEAVWESEKGCVSETERVWRREKNVWIIQSNPKLNGCLFLMGKDFWIWTQTCWCWLDFSSSQAKICLGGKVKDLVISENCSAKCGILWMKLWLRNLETTKAVWLCVDIEILLFLWEIT